MGKPQRTKEKIKNTVLGTLLLSSQRLNSMDLSGLTVTLEGLWPFHSLGRK